MIKRVYYVHVMRKDEENLQILIVDYLRKERPELTFWHTNNNAGFGNVRAGKKAKRLGVLPGVPDLFFPISNNVHHGLFIELKSAKGRLSPVQKQLKDKLCESGYLVKIARSFEETLTILGEYCDHGRSD